MTWIKAKKQSDSIHDHRDFDVKETDKSDIHLGKHGVARIGSSQGILICDEVKSHESIRDWHHQSGNCSPN
jgi:hypothetical protein